MENVTSQLMQRYFEAGKLGNLSAYISSIVSPTELKLSLASLHKAVTGMEAFKHTIRPEDIEAVCVKGSLLYKNYPDQFDTVEKQKKKYYFFGPVVRTKEFAKKVPKGVTHSVEVLVVANSEQGIKPSRLRNAIKIKEAHFVESLS